MIFHAKLATKVLSGEKTVTRHPASTDPRSPWWEVECTYQPSRRYSVQTGRSSPSLGMIRVTACPNLERLYDITTEEAQLEGFESVEAFLASWEKINGERDPDAKVWRVQFEVVR